MNCSSSGRKRSRRAIFSCFNDGQVERYFSTKRLIDSEAGQNWLAWNSDSSKRFRLTNPSTKYRMHSAWLTFFASNPLVMSASVSNFLKHAEDRSPSHAGLRRLQRNVDDLIKEVLHIAGRASHLSLVFAVL